MSADHPDLQCRRVVELVTDYLEHALSIDDRKQLEQHLLICGACVTFVDQHRALLHALSALAQNAREPPPQARARALASFHQLREQERR
jgi:hypothetical protein